MKKLIFIFILVLFNSVSAYCLDTPDDLKQEIAIAINNGKAIYAAYLNGPDSSKEISQHRDEIKDLCNMQYNAYKVNDTIYLIAESTSANDIVFGRHFKISGNIISSSTKSCFVLPTQPDKNAAAVYITHLLSEAPSEFHVFISLKSQKPIFVGTSKGTWKVEADTIEYINKNN